MLHCSDMPVARMLYTLLSVLALPAAAVFLWWRGRRHPGYRRDWGERFLGLAPRPDSDTRPLVWIHAVSVGETRAAGPLLEALLAMQPGLRVLLTHGTPTGRDTGRALFDDRIRQAYLPYDLPWAVARFLKGQRPALGLLVETEVWPNLVAACGTLGIPLCLVNARMSQRSLHGYLRVAALARPAFAGLTRTLAQTRADADRLLQLGAVDVRVTGNLKSDADPDPRQIASGCAWRQIWDAGERACGQVPRPVWLAASTREGEEDAVICAARAVATAQPRALLVWVPRHPHRIPPIEAALDQAGLSHQRRSRTTAPQPGTAVWLGDSLGELAAYIASADVVFMGGSLAKTGGQNLLEPCAQGKPVIVGPHTFNFLEVTDQALADGAALQVADAAELGSAVAGLLADVDRRSDMGRAALAFRQRHRGSLAGTFAGLADLLPGPQPAGGVSPGSGSSLTGTR